MPGNSMAEAEQLGGRHRGSPNRDDDETAIKVVVDGTVEVVSEGTKLLSS